MEKFTREEAKGEVSCDEQSIPYGDWGIYKHDVFHLIDKIYDQHEIELEQMFHKGVLNGNNAMKTKMEEEFKERTCENCKYIENTYYLTNNSYICDNIKSWMYQGNVIKKFGCNKWSKN